MPWFENCYSRFLLDCHLSDTVPGNMTKFSPSEYVRLVKLAGAESVMVYACCHNGNCYYPTRVGHMHRNLDGRDVFGETIALLNRSDLVPIAYYTVIYHNHSAKENPAWRCRDICGRENDQRYWFSCPNHPEYASLAQTQLREIAAYEIKGIFIDMTFWPLVCLCESCRRRYRKEVGREIPEVVNWSKPIWVSFQRTRERWLAEFAGKLTAAVKSIKPELTVVHQFSPVLHGWIFGQSLGIADASDYASGDFYGGIGQQRFGTKVFAAYSRVMPYEFMTSLSVNLRDHCSVKSPWELFAYAATTLANGGAYFFIDAINPDGTLCRDKYETLNTVSGKLHPFKKLVKKHHPNIHADIGIYFSMPACVNQACNHLNLKQLSASNSNMEEFRDNPALLESIGAAEALTECHIPYQIVNKRSAIKKWLKTLIVNDAAYLSDAEIETLRDFVRNGGTLIATGKTSLFNETGNSSGDFALKDVFGVSFSGLMTERVSYIAINFEANRFISCDKSAPLCMTSTARRLYAVAKPYCRCDDPEEYASIHSNPPGTMTPFCALSENVYGKGKCVYLYSAIIASSDYSQREFVKQLLRKYAAGGLAIATNAPPGIEFTFMKSQLTNFYIMGIVNFQKQQPQIPIDGLKISFRMSGIKAIIKGSDGAKLDFSTSGGIVYLEIKSLDTIELLEIETDKTG